MTSTSWLRSAPWRSRSDRGSDFAVGVIDRRQDARGRGVGLEWRGCGHGGGRLTAQQAIDTSPVDDLMLEEQVDELEQLAAVVGEDFGGPGLGGAKQVGHLAVDQLEGGLGARTDSAGAA